jgi:hypothetical protein
MSAEFIPLKLPPSPPLEALLADTRLRLPLSFHGFSPPPLLPPLPEFSRRRDACRYAAHMHAHARRRRQHDAASRAAYAVFITPLTSAKYRFFAISH